ncbi:unnamed protein product [Bursaphelenchus okinawaensis]|uniref:Uncharacterized protein n=1 Tax=Bursaphelenchus okinawaensis TaxID=465554 RepID=A0A811K731_9BILA|nr:unnamed protein product [Bursaphelenchus okinawaensis]CAG9093107.1 unnamed protein product [Bursaphelenchus okinawaensis]
MSSLSHGNGQRRSDEKRRWIRNRFPMGSTAPKLFAKSQTSDKLQMSVNLESTPSNKVIIPHSFVDVIKR